MEPQREQELAHLGRLADELAKQGFQAEVVAEGRRPYARVTNPEHSDLTERVLCQLAEGTWCFWWSWQHPIGPVDDVALAARRVMTALRSVEGSP